MKKICWLTFLLLCASAAEARLPELIPFRKGNLWGYSDSTKEIIIEPQYEHAEFFEFGRAVVKKNGKFGVIDTHGKTIVSCFYRELKSAPISGYWKAIMFGSKCGIVDSNNKFCVPAIYDRIDWCGGAFICTCGEGERKIMNLHHEVIATYSAIASDAGAEYLPSAKCFLVQISGKYGIIDRNGKVRLPAVYDRIAITSCGYFIAEKNGNSSYYSSTLKRKKKLPKHCAKLNSNTGRFLIPASIRIYEHSHDFLSSVSVVVDSSKFSLSWGWQNEDGLSWAMMPKYESAGFFAFGLATFGHDGKLGVVDSSFNEVIEPKYELVFPVRPNFVMIMRKPRVDFAKHPDLRLFMGYVDIHGTEYWED